jgi:hypothetical protein
LKPVAHERTRKFRKLSHGDAPSSGRERLSYEGAMDGIMDAMLEHRATEVEQKLAETQQSELEEGEDFFFEVPHHAANRLFAERLKAMGFERSNLIRNDEFDRFYMPEGTDLDVVTQEYSEYFNAGEAPEPTVIPLGFLTPGRSADDWPPDN